MADVTQILAQLDSDDTAAAQRLLTLVYDELRNLARSKLAREKPGHTLQATALVHEAYLRLVDVKQPQQWNSRGHFFSAAAEAMRRILIEQARRKNSVKGGGGWRRVELPDVGVTLTATGTEMLALDEAINKLADDDAPAARLARLRLFTGLSLQEAAIALQLAPSTARRRWAYARAFLQLELQATQ